MIRWGGQEPVGLRRWHRRRVRDGWIRRDDGPDGELVAIVVLAATIFVGLILQGGDPIPSSGSCAPPCVVVELGR